MPRNRIGEAVAITLFASGNVGSVALVGANAGEVFIPIELQMPNQAYLREDDSLVELPDQLDDQPLKLELPKSQTSLHDDRAYSVRRNYGRSGQLGHRTRGDVHTFRHR